MTNSTNKSPIIILALSLACSAPSADNGADPQATGAVRATEASGGHGYPGDPTIEAGLQLLDVRSRSRSGLLRADFILHNVSGEELAGSWTVVWSAADGAPLAVPLIWSPLNLAPDGSRAMSISAPGPEAASWTLHAVGAGAARGSN